MTREHNTFPRAISLAVHELLTPVAVVSGYLRMLLREQGGPLTDKQRKMLEEAERSCGRLGALVAEMSEFGKLEGGELAFGRQEFDLGTLITDLASGMHEGEDRGVRLEVRLTPALADHQASPPGSHAGFPITGDRPRLTAALNALMRSALRERGEPGTVVVACEIRRAQDQGARDTAWAIVAIGGEADLTPLVAHAVAAPPPFDEWRGGLGLALPV